MWRGGGGVWPQPNFRLQQITILGVGKQTCTFCSDFLFGGGGGPWKCYCYNVSLALRRHLLLCESYSWDGKQTIYEFQTLFKSLVEKSLLYAYFMKCWLLYSCTKQRIHCTMCCLNQCLLKNIAQWTEPVSYRIVKTFQTSPLLSTFQINKCIGIIIYTETHVLKPPDSLLILLWQFIIKLAIKVLSPQTYQTRARPKLKGVNNKYQQTTTWSQCTLCCVQWRRLASIHKQLTWRYFLTD